MHIIIQLREDMALELRNRLREKNNSQDVNPEIQNFLSLVNEIDARLEPVHPNATDPLLLPFFMIAATDRELAEGIIVRMSEFKIVEAAYLKPDEELA